jgi:hypothetical protein
MDAKPKFFGPLSRREQYERHPETGEYFAYSRYRDAIAEDCRNRCVYCDSHEDTIGGREATQLDHFRPWNKSFGDALERKFSHLLHDPMNLVHSCGVCNRFKSARWPTDDPNSAHNDKVGWVDPFSETRSDFLAVEEDGAITPVKPLGKYLITTLRLNRPLLRRQRELRFIVGALEARAPKWRAIVESDPNGELGEMARTVLTLVETIRGQCCPE